MDCFAMLGGYEVLGILAIVLVLFGAKKVPELARGLGQGIKEFKKATNDVTADLQRAIEEDNSSTPPPPPAPAESSKPQTTDTPEASASKDGSDTESKA